MPEKKIGKSIPVPKKDINIFSKYFFTFHSTAKVVDVQPLIFLLTNKVGVK